MGVGGHGARPVSSLKDCAVPTLPLSSGREASPVISTWRPTSCDNAGRWSVGGRGRGTGWKARTGAVIARTCSASLLTRRSLGGYTADFAGAPRSCNSRCNRGLRLDLVGEVPPNCPNPVLASAQPTPDPDAQRRCCPRLAQVSLPAHASGLWSVVCSPAARGHVRQPISCAWAAHTQPHGERG